MKFSNATKSNILLSFAVAFSLCSCGHSGPSVSDIQSAIDQQLQNAGPMGSILGPVTVSAASCSSTGNGNFNCDVTATAEGQQETKTMVFTQVNGQWTIVSQ